MHIRTLLFAAFVALSAPAAADFETVTEAYEVRLADLRLPGAAGGTVSFKPCIACPYETVRVSAKTRYTVNGRAYTLGEFRKQLEKVADPGSEWLTVMHHLESDTITAVEVLL